MSFIFDAFGNVGYQSEQELVKVDRYLLSQTWWNLLQKLKGRSPNILDDALCNMAYNKIVEGMKSKTDDELLQDMKDIVDSIEFVSLNIPALRENRGYYKK